MASPHGHHDSNSMSGEFAFAAIFLLGLALLEIRVGRLVHNPAVISDGGHNISDFLFILVGLAVSLITSRSKSHFLACSLSSIAGAVVSILTVGFVGVFAIMESLRNEQVVPGSLYVGVGAGVIAFWSNRYFAKRLSHGKDANSRAMSLHLRTDAWASLVIIPGTVMAVVTGQRAWNVVAAGVIMLLTAWHNLKEAKHSLSELHLAKNHH